MHAQVTLELSAQPLRSLERTLNAADVLDAAQLSTHRQSAASVRHSPREISRELALRVRVFGRFQTKQPFPSCPAACRAGCARHIAESS